MTRKNCNICLKTNKQNVLFVRYFYFYYSNMDHRRVSWPIFARAESGEVSKTVSSLSKNLGNNTWRTGPAPLFFFFSFGVIASASTQRCLARVRVTASAPFSVSHRV